MFDVVRRRVASSCSFQMFLGRFLQKKFRYGSSLSRISSIKIALHSGGCGSVQNFYHRSSLGCCWLNLKTLREISHHEARMQTITKQFSTNSEEDVVDVLVPPLAESISDGTLAKFLKNPGDSVSVDETIAQIETDKVTIDVPSPTTGIILKLVVNEGDTVKPGHKSESEEDSPQPGQKISEKKKAPNVEATPKRIETSVTTKESPKANIAPQLPPNKGERRVSDNYSYY
ncbi:dihydrolipoyllysine-residue succinyltransferase component of 2-oxoglutarate dehydrogenase complex 2, mitochondrial-like [Arachis ipaensis]|uniref:dihydrolipoyllysine-residue succinyltransferase component of 2-oxoglutarate dehydrogenase complex 2, mitochondrial-like n=1 Tax=Arachis ipaensis TaxID=130454 RepID=UPI000A2B96E4|nr:dihydrolipoyllysine-residue succinyltransferase component of 2-oxoglutarate dehydrogenase complex 2, mitochondrial-like [Arachis ipaensis]